MARHGNTLPRVLQHGKDPLLKVSVAGLGGGFSARACHRALCFGHGIAQNICLGTGRSVSLAYGMTRALRLGF
jgi:hypothetical protein